jgi:hypothetical protein
LRRAFRASSFVLNIPRAKVTPSWAPNGPEMSRLASPELVLERNSRIRAGQVGSSEWLGAPRELDDQLRPIAIPFTCIPAALVHDSKPVRRNEVQ